MFCGISSIWHGFWQVTWSYDFNQKRVFWFIHGGTKKKHCQEWIVGCLLTILLSKLCEHSSSWNGDLAFYQVTWYYSSTSSELSGCFLLILLFTFCGRSSKSRRDLNMMTSSVSLNLVRTKLGSLTNPTVQIWWL